MSLNSAEINFIKAVKAGIHGENAMLKDADYSALFETAMQQKLLPFVFEAVRKTSALQQNQALFAAEKQQVIYGKQIFICKAAFMAASRSVGAKNF